MNFVSLTRNLLHWLLPVSSKFRNLQLPSCLTDPASCLLRCLEWSLSYTHSSGEFSLILLWAPVLSHELDRHWERSRDSNPNIGCFPIPKKHTCVSLWQNKTNIQYQERSETAAVPGKQRRNQNYHFSNPAWLLSYKPDFLLYVTHRICWVSFGEDFSGIRIHQRQNTGVHLGKLPLFSNFNI